MKIPVFVSCPTTLTESQQASRMLILDMLDRLELEPRAVGVSDFATQFPLREVAVLARHCSGGVILGFEQFRAQQGIRKCGTPKQMEVTNLKFPTEWNHIETGVLFSAGLPLLVFKEREIAGGIFDLGAADVFLHDMPNSTCSDVHKRQLSAVFLKWQADVRRHYYECCFK
jgi:hypothetical protein